MKFILLVEGQTERDNAAAFLKRWLDPKLNQPVGIQPVRFDGYANLVGKMQARAKKYLESSEQSEIIAVIALIDLYGPRFYPDDKTTADERFTWGRSFFEQQVGLSKFRLFFAVHEFEAWLLSQPEIFAHEIQGPLRSSAARPERVNFDQPPAKLLNQVYNQKTRHDYKKTTHGKQLFAKLDPEIAADKCPRLKELLNEMLSLAEAAGLGRRPEST